MIDMTKSEADYLKYRFKQYLGSVSREIQNRRLKEQKIEMTIHYVIEDGGIVKEVCLSVSPIEYLVISSALKQFAENPNNYSADVEVAKKIREVIENHGNEL